MTKGNPRLSQIVGRHFNVYPISDADADKILSHLAGDVGQHFVAVLQSHSKHRARQNLCDSAGDFYWLFFGHALATYFFKSQHFATQTELRQYQLQGFGASKMGDDDEPSAVVFGVITAYHQIRGDPLFHGLNKFPLAEKFHFEHRHPNVL